MDRCPRCFGDLHDLAVFCPNCGQMHEPDFNQLINRTVGNHFQIYRRLGQGGLSTVFAATDLESDQLAVVKVSDPAQLIRREMSYTIESQEARRYWTEMIERMRREAETLATINHPNIVRFYASGTINDDLRYVVMEHLRGRTLRHEIDIKRRLELAEALHIALEVCSALSEVHSRGIIHRDINPRNVMIADETDDEHQRPVIKLIDFGIAKFPQPPGAPPFTQHSAMSGTVAYASPEQCQNRSVDHRTDIYSLGIVLYEMLTGLRPFDGRTPTEVALKQIQTEPKPPRAINPDLPASLEITILRALAKNPADRQQSIEELAIELHAGSNQIIIPLNQPVDSEVDHEPNDQDEDDEDEKGEELRLVRQRRRRAVVAATALLVALTTVGILFGKDLIASFHPSGRILGHQPGSRTENFAAGTSPSPPPAVLPSESNLTAPGSDADALELASRLSQGGNAAAAGPQAAVTKSMQTKPLTPPSAKIAAGASIAAHRSLPAPPKAKPKVPPAPAPTIAAKRLPQPTSQPDITQAPRREESRQPSQLEGGVGPTQVNPDRGNNSESTKQPPRVVEGQADKSDDPQADPQNVGPTIIQWVGKVDRERVIKIEMPGVPGTIEIPRGYRDRVGVVEPPGTNNGWSCAVLRVFGRGRVSILVRWWPVARGITKFTVKR